MDGQGTPGVDERLAPVNGIEIAYEDLGDPDGAPILLVMGLGMQLVGWEPEFCELLTGRGYRAIRFDNRDTGHSTKIEAPMPGMLEIFAGRRRTAAYTLDDMADDAAGLLDHLQIESAHVVGASMGGMIGQVLAIRHPARVRSLALLMTHPGSRRLGFPRLRAFGTLIRAAPKEREAYAEHAVRVFRIIGSPGFPTNSERVRRLALAGYDRCRYPVGIARQMHAITASRDRIRELRRLRAPTVVIHGDSDPLVRPAGGRALARLIPGARLVMVPGMGHDLAPGAWPLIASEIDRNVARAEEDEERPTPLAGAKSA